MSRRLAVVLVSAALGLLVGIGVAHAFARPAARPANVPSLESAPMVPHDDYPEESCARCHGPGASDGSAVPLTPHPERTMCRQCHVPVSDAPLFVENAWQD